MQNEDKVIEKNACDVCGTEVDVNDNKMGCDVCDDRYFGKIKESYNQNLKIYDITSKDLFKLYFDLSDEIVKSSYNISEQYLTIEKNLRVYNPSLYYLLTSYQSMRNHFLVNTMKSINTMYSGFTNVWKANISAMTKSVISTLENMNTLYSTCNKIMNIKEKQSISEEDKRLVKTISVVNRMYHTYQKEDEIMETDNSENTTKVLKKK